MWLVGPGECCSSTFRGKKTRCRYWGRKREGGRERERKRKKREGEKYREVKETRTRRGISRVLLPGSLLFCSGRSVLSRLQQCTVLSLLLTIIIRAWRAFYFYLTFALRWLLGLMIAWAHTVFTILLVVRVYEIAFGIKHQRIVICERQTVAEKYKFSVARGGVLL